MSRVPRDTHNFFAKGECYLETAIVNVEGLVEQRLEEDILPDNPTKMASRDPKN